jgi:hypothetical protein
MKSQLAMLTRESTKQAKQPPKEAASTPADHPMQTEFAASGRKLTPFSLGQIHVLPPQEPTPATLFPYPDLRLPIQPKLAIGAINDPLESEADEMAERVISMPGPGEPILASGPAAIRRRDARGSSSADQTEATAEDEKDVQRKALIAPTPAAAPPIVHEVLASPGQPLDANTRTFMESRFGHDFSRVRVHLDTTAKRSALAVNALAYTVGSNIVFGSYHYAPRTAGGQKLLAHELAHVLQQGSRTGWLRRRVPGAAGLGAALPTDPAGFASVRTGLARDLSRAWAGLTTAQQTTVKTAAAGFGISFTDEADLRTRLETATRPELLQFAQEIRTAAPSAELGDPLLIDVGARPHTADAANITTLVNNANAVFASIASGAKDADITQVFGAANVAAAKAKYANAKTRLNALKTADKIVTDRSGFSAQVSLGGLSNASQIAVEPSTIDNPGDKESVITLIHESMHAGNSDVRDFGYIHQPSFIALPESVKLKNAAHFEVVPRRILGASFDFAGQTFIPAGTTVGGVAAPALTPKQQAIRAASETYRSAWTAGLNLHKIFVRLFRTPAEWNTLDLSTAFSGAPAGAHFADTLPFWSKVEMLTMHERVASINPAGPPAVRPVTLIDIALSEGVTRKLDQGMDHVPQTEADAQALETASANAAELTAAAASVNAERDLLIRLVIRVNLGSITGTVSRDESVVARMAQASNAPNFTDILAIRPPSAFP